MVREGEVVPYQYAFATHAGVRAYLDLMGLRGADRRDAFAGIQACEAATLQAWAEQRE